MLICILPPIQFTILHHLMYGTLCACWPWCIWLLSIWLSILLLRMNHCVWAVTCTGIYTRMAGGGSTYACDVSVQFLYETVFTHMTGELWIFAGWWCALSYFVYVFLYDINLLLYIFLPAFPSFPCTCVCSLMYLTCVFVYFMHHLMHVFFIHIDMWRNYLLTFIFVHFFRLKETGWPVVGVF